MTLREWLANLFRRPPVSPPPPAPPPPTGSGGLVGEINRARSAHGLPPLVAEARLMGAAQGWATSMFLARRLEHGDFSGRIRAAGYVAAAAGETIAQGQVTAAQVVTDWLSSPGHRAILLSNNFTQVGVGQTGAYWCADFALPG